ncbi:MAG: hypothetical protein QW320_06590 [Ignisphaera sp.]|uniref:hypothetical protein n=1 Tax=Thermofilum sp. TaxID=1961369 RepID=UPI003163EF1A
MSNVKLGVKVGPREYQILEALMKSENKCIEGTGNLLTIVHGKANTRRYIRWFIARLYYMERKGLILVFKEGRSKRICITARGILAYERKARKRSSKTGGGSVEA